MLAEVGAMVGAYACGTGLALIPGLRQVLTQTALCTALCGTAASEGSQAKIF